MKEKMKKMLMLALMMIVVLAFNVNAQDEILVLHRTVKDCATDLPVQDVNNGQEQVFEVGVDVGYGNYECSNRKQEQCFDDGCSSCF